jgi:hypothetical protein
MSSSERLERWLMGTHKILLQSIGVQQFETYFGGLEDVPG